MVPNRSLTKEKHIRRLLVASFNVAEADVDGLDAATRQPRNAEFDRVLREAAQAGYPQIYRDAVRLLGFIADMDREDRGR